jgi:hypothetical protein
MNLNTTTFGSNSDGVFDAIATLYCRKNDKQRTPSNVVSHDVFFRRPRFRLYCDVSNVARETFQTWQDRRFKRGKRDVSNVARETFQTWQDTFQTWQERRRFKRGKRDVSNVARETWQERRCKRRFKRGKRDVSNVARPRFKRGKRR